jgi:hypothetical protein
MRCTNGWRAWRRPEFQRSVRSNTGDDKGFEEGQDMYRLMGSIVAIGLVLILSTTCSDGASSTSSPVRLDKSGIVSDIVFDINKHTVYYFRLNFAFGEGADRDRVLRIVGSQDGSKNRRPSDPGVLTPVKLSIYKIGGKGRELVYVKTIEPFVTSWSSTEFGKILGHCDLRPGKYRLLLESMVDAAEYSTIETRVVVSPSAGTFHVLGLDRSKSALSDRGFVGNGLVSH